MARDTARHARAHDGCSAASPLNPPLDRLASRSAAGREAVVILPAPSRAQPATDHLAHTRTPAAPARATPPDAECSQARLLQESRALRQMSQETIARARAARDRARRGRSQQEILRDSAFARLLARMETMPVIEQAKGIIMAQSRCGEAEAFDILRRASQRSNLPLRDLASRIVATTAGTTGPDTQSHTSMHARTRRLRAG